MRVEPYAVGSYVHVVKRGARGMPITGDLNDKRRFLRLLFYMNDEFLDIFWDRSTRRELFSRPDTWPERKPLVSILAFTLMTNHFHLLLREITDAGISRFMQRTGQAMTNHHNEKYQQKGSIFQGAYHGKTVNDDTYLRHVAAYIMVKNTFELYPRGGLRAAMANFDDAYEWAAKYQFSSFADYAGTKSVSILDKDILADAFPNPHDFKLFARDLVEGSKWGDDELE